MRQDECKILLDGLESHSLFWFQLFKIHKSIQKLSMSVVAYLGRKVPTLLIGGTFLVFGAERKKQLGFNQSNNYGYFAIIAASLAFPLLRSYI